MKAKIVGISYSPFTRETSYMFAAAGTPSEEIVSLKEKDVSLYIEKWSERKTDNQRRYVWELLTKLARAKKRTAYEEYEDHLRETPLFYKDKKGIPETIYLKRGREPSPDKNKHWLWLQDVEVQETKKDKPRTMILSVYSRIRGMSSFNKDEMKDFIENVVYDCKSNGIETLTPDEILAMENNVPS